jgi:hypothetical protein
VLGQRLLAQRVGPQQRLEAGAVLRGDLGFEPRAGRQPARQAVRALHQRHHELGVVARGAQDGLVE